MLSKSVNSVDGVGAEFRWRFLEQSVGHPRVPYWRCPPTYIDDRPGAPARTRPIVGAALQRWQYLSILTPSRGVSGGFNEKCAIIPATSSRFADGQKAIS